MAKASNIIRSSIHSFFCNYDTFASLAVLLVFPASAVTLLSSSLIPSSSSNFLLSVSHRIHSLFESANFPSNCHLFPILTLKLSQRIFCFLFTLPFTLTFLNLSKTYIIFSTCKPPLQRHNLPPVSSILHLYLPLLLTHLYTIFVTLTAYCTVFSAFLAVDVLGLISPTSFLTITGAGAILYSIILGYALVISNLAGIVSAKEKSSGYSAVLIACLLIRGRATVALTLALCINLALVGIEHLFRMRVTRPYQQLGETFDISLMCEALTITYMYSIVSVIDIMIMCCFYKSCRADEMVVKYEDQFVVVGELEREEKGDYLKV